MPKGQTPSKTQSLTKEIACRVYRVAIAVPACGQQRTADRIKVKVFQTLRVYDDICSLAAFGFKSLVCS
ncbi:MAG: hypothetical protein ACPIOQ_43400, partial [Promethearchaeia archaeon]